MKGKRIIPWIAVLAMPVLAQQTNDLRKGSPGRQKQPTEQQRQQHQDRKYRFLEKSLTQMGVGEEDKAKIRRLQTEHRKKMKANMQRMNQARKALSALEDSEAGEAEIERAIQKIAAAQAEQLRILVSNRREMEKILGRERYARFMENARAQYRKHDHRSGAGIPPRPDLPPTPPKHRALPPSPLGEYVQFMDHAREQFFKKQIKEGKPPPMPEEYIRFMDRARTRFFKTHPPETPPNQ